MNDSQIEGSETEEPEAGAPEIETPPADVVETEAQDVEPAEPEADEEPSPVPDAGEETSPEPAAEDVKETMAATPEDQEAELTKEETLEPAKETTGPGIVQKILLWAAIVVAGIFFVLGVASIIGVWAANTPVTNTILAVLQPIDNALQRLETISGEAGVALDGVSTSLDEADQRVQELGSGLAETSLAREALTRILDVDLEQKTTTASAGIRSIYDTVVAVEETVNAVNAIPFVNVEVPGGDEISAIRTGMEETAATVEEVRQENQRRREERADTLVTAITTPLDRMSDNVDGLYTRVSSAETRFGQAIERVKALQENVPRWIDILSIIATLLFAWLMFSQAAVIVLCWRAMHDQPPATAA